MTKEQLRAAAVPLGLLAVGVISYATFSLGDDSVQLENGELGVLVCPERIEDGEMRDDIKASPVAQRALRKGQRYALVGRVVSCASSDGGVCSDDTDALLLEKKATKQRDITSERGCRLDPCSAHGKACQNRKRLFIVEPPCMVPNCWRGDAGEWVDDATADCQRRAPNPEGKIETRWAGCNVMAKEQAVGSECVPVACEVFSGDSAASL